MCGFIFSVATSYCTTHSPSFEPDTATKFLSYRNGYNQRLTESGSLTINDGCQQPFQIKYVFVRLPTDPSSFPQPIQSNRSATFFNGSIYGISQSSFNREDIKSIITPDLHLLHEQLSARQTYDNLRFLSTLYGTFAVAHIDSRLGYLYLARDCFGERPLFYKLTDSHAIVSSDPRAIASSPDFSRTNLSSFITHGYLRDISHIYPGVIEVPPNTFIVINLYTKKVVDQYSIHALPNAEDREYDYRGTLESAVKCSFPSSTVHGKTFVAASSGIDSSFLLNSLTSFPYSFSIYTATFHTLEHIYSEFVGLKTFISLNHPAFHKSLRNVSVNIEDCFERLLFLSLNRYSPSNGCFNIEALASIVNSSQSYRYCLTGVGLDELLGGYNSFKYWPLFRSIPISIWHKINPRFSYANTLRNSGVNHKILLYYFMYRLDIDSLLLIKSEDDRIGVLGESWHNFCLLMAKMNILNHVAPPDVILSLCETFDYMSMQVLRDYDQIAHSYSLDIRNPFLTPRLLNAPKDSKKLLRQTILTNRQKSGFSFPLPKTMSYLSPTLFFGSEFLNIEMPNPSQPASALKFNIAQHYASND